MIDYGVVPFYHNKECYEMYIEARKTEIKRCKDLIKTAKKRIKDKEWYHDGHTEDNVVRLVTFKITQKDELKIKELLNK